MPVVGRDLAGGVAAGRARRDEPLDLGERGREAASAAASSPRGERPPVLADDEHELAAERQLAVRAPRRASSPSAPRTISSWSFVSSRQTAAGRSGAARGGQVAQRGRDPARRLEHDRAPLVGGDPGDPLPTLPARSAAGTPRTTSAARRRRSRRRPPAPPMRPGSGRRRRPRPPTRRRARRRGR